MTIHPTAVINDKAQIAPDAEIGPFAVIGPNVTIGSGTKIDAHTIIDGVTTIGANCHLFPGVSVGLDPQDLSYKQELTGVKIGDNVILREYVTVHKAVKEGFTEIGDDAYLMNYVHIAHNCKLGKGVILANSTTLAGYVTVGDYVVTSGMCVFHQHVRLGRLSMLSGMTGTRLDLPPFSTCDGRPALVRGVNAIGMRRRGIKQDVRSAIKEAYRLIYRSGLNVSQALTRIEEEIQPSPEISEIIEFFRSTKRGVAGLITENTELLEELPSEAI